jgi:hypothetical protein
LELSGHIADFAAAFTHPGFSSFRSSMLEEGKSGGQRTPIARDRSLGNPPAN